MKHRIGIAGLLIIVSIVAVIVVVNMSTRSTESTGAASQAVAATASGSQELPSGDVEAAYDELTSRLQELESKARTVRSTQERVDILNQMEIVLSEFIAEYKGSPQAAEMSFDAGMVIFSLQKPKKAIRYLESFVNDAVDPGRDKQAYAHFYLAEAYKQVGEYDDAEAEYKTILADFSDVDQRMTGMVQQNMAMLESERRLKIGAPPIDFAVTSVDGKKLSPEQYRGKVLLLDFWATWCAPCRQEMPNVIEVYDKYNEKGFEIVGISLDRSRADFDRYVEKNEMNWPQFFDGKFWQNEVATLYGVKSIPATYLIDKKGKIRYKSLRGHQLEVAVKELLAE
jgi:peroxiredoxin/TolA-binding protein